MPSVGKYPFNVRENWEIVARKNSECNEAGSFNSPKLLLELLNGYENKENNKV